MNEGFYLIEHSADLPAGGTEPGWTPEGGCYGGVMCHECILADDYDQCNYDLEELQRGLPKGTAYFKVTDYPELFI